MGLSGRAPQSSQSRRCGTAGDLRPPSMRRRVLGTAVAALRPGDVGALDDDKTGATALRTNRIRGHCFHYRSNGGDPWSAAPPWPPITGIPHQHSSPAWTAHPATLRPCRVSSRRWLWGFMQFLPAGVRRGALRTRPGNLPPCRRPGLAAALPAVTRAVRIDPVAMLRSESQRAGPGARYTGSNPMRGTRWLLLLILVAIVYGIGARYRAQKSGCASRIRPW